MVQSIALWAAVLSSGCGLSPAGVEQAGAGVAPVGPTLVIMTERDVGLIARFRALASGSDVRFVGEQWSVAPDPDPRAQQAAFEAERERWKVLPPVVDPGDNAAGAPDALKIALSGENPSDVARRLYYLAELSRATARLGDALRANLAEAEDVRRAAEARRQRLAAIAAESRRDRARILAERGERRTILNRVSGELRKARRQISTLEADERRLARLVEEIGRVLAARPGAGFARVEKVPSLGSLAGPFAGLRGRLRLPVRGELVGLFGAPREEGPVGKKGVFIRAKEGQPVLAIAAGQVVFADWMRGYGNLLIVDHGEGYLSIYANNESLLKQTGDPVAAGEIVATVGANGGNEQSGLYFELRHLGKAFDPLGWVVLK